jgi:hypothetical protein
MTEANGLKRSAYGVGMGHFSRAKICRDLERSADYTAVVYILRNQSLFFNNFLDWLLCLLLLPED